ncbi:MAG: HlyD family secretion protein [Anaerolineales bacterium]
MKKHLSKLVSLIAVFSMVLSACTVLNGANTTDLKASGTISAREVNIASQIGGQVVSVSVEEGVQVTTGDELFRLDDSLLQAQRNVATASLETAQSAAAVAEAGLASAQVQYDMAVKTALSEEQPNRTADWLADKPADFNQPVWYFSKAELLKSAQANLAAAETALNQAQENLSTVEQRSAGQGFLDIEKLLSDARLAYQIAQSVLDKANAAQDGQDLKDEAQSRFDDTKVELENAQKKYDNALTTEGANDVLQARAKVSIAQETYDAALDYSRTLETGMDSPRVVAAKKALEQAEAVAQQAQSATMQVQANLELIDAQIAKTVIVAPIDGVVLIRNLEVGETVAPGSVVMVIGQLVEVELVVYIPVTEYGKVQLSDQVFITVDSFPGETFNGTVVYISDKAEFTPRNVQTVEGRQATVYAIKLTVPNANLKLKPGMPADVIFSK